MKKILIFLLALILCACAKTVPERNIDTKVKLLFFYISTCSECKAFQSEAIPYLEKSFGENIEIELYDLDDSQTKEIYDNVIDSLADFDESMYGMGPMYAVDTYYAKVGYTSGDEEELANDIEKAVKHQELGYELEAYRFYYKEEK